MRATGNAGAKQTRTQLNMRLTPEQHADLRKQADKLAKDMTEFVMDCIRDANRYHALIVEARLLELRGAKRCNLRVKA